MKSRFTQALWGAGEEPPANGKSPENSHPPSTPGCFDRPRSQHLQTPPGGGEQEALAEAATPPKGMDERCDGPGSVAELEKALRLEQRRSSQKEQELAVLQQLLAKLEGSIEQQARDAKLEQERISMLEKALEQQQHLPEGDQEQTLLLMAVAGEKQRAEDLEKELHRVKQQLQDETFRRRRSEEEALSRDEQLRTLRQQFAEEQCLRRVAERRLADRDTELKEVTEGLHRQQSSALAGIAEDQVVLPSAAEERIAIEVAKRKMAEDLVQSRQARLEMLEHQLAEELTKREALQMQLLTKQGQLNELERQVSGPASISSQGLETQRCLQSQVIEKEREVCDLQQQLAAELSKRREVQYQNIERERLVHEKDRQVAELRAEVAALRQEQTSRHSINFLPRVCGRDDREEHTPQILFRPLLSKMIEEGAAEHHGHGELAVAQASMVNPVSFAGVCTPMLLRPTSSEGSSSGGTTTATASYVAPSLQDLPVGHHCTMVAHGPSVTAPSVPPVAAMQVLSGQMRQRAYWTPVHWSPVPPGSVEQNQSSIQRRLAMASRTFS